MSSSDGKMVYINRAKEYSKALRIFNKRNIRSRKPKKKEEKLSAREKARMYAKNILPKHRRRNDDNTRNNIIIKRANILKKEKYNKRYEGCSPIVVACELGRLDDLKTLVDGYIAEGNDNNAVKSWLEQIGKGIESHREYYNTLMAAAKNEHEKVLKYLLTYNVNPTITNSDGENALHYSARYNWKSTECVELLLNNMNLESINQMNKFGATPLDYAYDNENNNKKQEIIALVQGDGGKAKKHYNNGEQRIWNLEESRSGYGTHGIVHYPPQGYRWEMLKPTLKF